MGGLTRETNAKMGITKTLSFGDERFIDPFRYFHFGTRERTIKWIELFEACRIYEVPIFILTSGDQRGIVYSLQLMNLDYYISDVLCNKDSTMTKYQIIENEKLRDAFVEKPVNTSDGGKGYLVDDADCNRDSEREASTKIKFIDSKSVSFRANQYRVKSESSGAVSSAQPQQPQQEQYADGAGDYDAEAERGVFVPKIKDIYKQIFPREDCELGAYNLIPIDIIDMLIREAPRMSVLYLDYDMTLQRYGNSIPFTTATGELSETVRVAFNRNNIWRRIRYPGCPYRV